MVRAIPRELRRLPEVRIARIVIGVAVAAFVVLLPLFMTHHPSDLNLMSIALVWGIVAVSLVVLTGWGGHISLGQFAIVGTGAVTSGLLQQHANVDFFVTLAAAGAVGGVVALLLGLPALRIRGPFLAVTTLAFAVALDSHILNPSVFPKIIPDIGDRPTLWGRFPLESERATFYLCLAILGLTILVAQGVRKSRSGRVLVATRENDRAAGAAAVPTTAAKLSGFVLAGVIAGVAGGLHVLILHHAGAGTYKPDQSLDVFAMAVIGGLGSIGGALLGVFSLRLLEQVVSGAVRLVITGAGLLVILLFLRGGIAEALMRIRNVLLRAVAKRRGIVVPSLLADKRVADEEDAPEDEVDLIATALDDEAAPGAAPAPEKVGSPR
jgi:branched-chain amino acid transport system permease protein